MEIEIFIHHKMIGMFILRAITEALIEDVEVTTVTVVGDIATVVTIIVASTIKTNTSKINTNKANTVKHTAVVAAVMIMDNGEGAAEDIKLAMAVLRIPGSKHPEEDIVVEEVVRSITIIVIIDANLFIHMVCILLIIIYTVTKLFYL